MIEDFKKFLINQGKSVHTIKSYTKYVSEYIIWLNDSFGCEFSKLDRENAIEYSRYLLNIKKLNAKSVNIALAALIKFNNFLIIKQLQDKQVLFKYDYIKSTAKYVRPKVAEKPVVEGFIQKISVNASKREYAIVTLIAYSGMRISEVTNLKISDVNLTAKVILVRSGKEIKQRLVKINDTIINAIKDYLSERNNYKSNESEYLFVSRESEKINNTVINRIFNKYSDKLTPYSLRHFFCSNAIKEGWSAHMVANQVGHSNIHTTLSYINPMEIRSEENQ